MAASTEEFRINQLGDRLEKDMQKGLLSLGIGVGRIDAIEVYLL